jgi:hypothetical protein
MKIQRFEPQYNGTSERVAAQSILGFAHARPLAVEMDFKKGESLL